MPQENFKENSSVVMAKKQGRLAALLAVTEPYRALISIGVAVVVALSGAVSWAVAHFATQSQIYYLECRMNTNLQNQVYSMQMDIIGAEINWRNLQIAQLADQSGAGGAILKLTTDINELSKKQSQLSNDDKKNRDELSKKCNGEMPATTAS